MHDAAMMEVISRKAIFAHISHINSQFQCSFSILTLWQAERHFCHIRFTGAATILSFVHSMFTSLDSIGSAVGKRPIEHVIATSQWPTEY